METANVKEPVFHHHDHKLYIIRLLKLPTFDNLMRKNKGSDLHVLYNTGKKSSRLQTRMIKKKCHRSNIFPKSFALRERDKIPCRHGRIGRGKKRHHYHQGQSILLFCLKKCHEISLEIIQT